MAHLNRDLYDPFTPVLLCPFIEDVKAALDGVPDILESFLDSIALGMTPGKGRATDTITAIFRIILDDDFKIHLINIRLRMDNRFWTRGIHPTGCTFFLPATGVSA